MAFYFNTLFQADYRNIEADLYKDAVTFGIEYAKGEDPSTGIDAAWYTARYAARQTAIALMAEAADMGLTAEQLERLRVVAADVAYD